MPAIRADAMTSPFLIIESLISRQVSGFIKILPVAIATRWDVFLFLTSIIIAFPLLSR